MTSFLRRLTANTVGEKLKGRRPDDFVAAKTGGIHKKLNDVQLSNSLTILDSACGSGSFLVRAYDYLLKWYLEKYTKKQSLNKNEKDGKNL